MDLDRLEDLHQSTTPGPWELGDGGWGVYIGAPDQNVWAREDVPNPADVEFAVVAHRALPALITEVRALRQAVSDTGAALLEQMDG
jgi:hypothetical protein